MVKKNPKILRVGIIGCGNIFRSHAPVYIDNPYAVITGLYDRIQNRANVWFNQIKDQMHLLRTAAKAENEKDDPLHLTRCDIFREEAKVYSNVENLIENVDVVDICAPTYTHAPYVKWALKKDKNVMVEKPPARCSLETEEICNLARKSQSKVQINENFLWQRYLWEFHKIIKKGQIGEIKKVHIKLGHGGPSWGWQNHFLNPSLSGGGILSDMGSHAIAAGLVIVGIDSKIQKIKSIHMHTGTEKERTIQKIDGQNEYYVQKYMVEDEALIKIWFQTSYNSKPFPLFIETSWSKTYNEIQIQGTEGKLVLDHDKSKRKIIQVIKENGSHNKSLPPQARDSHQLEVLDFLFRLSKDNPIWANESLAHKIQLIISGAYLSNLKAFETARGNSYEEGFEITLNDLDNFYKKIKKTGIPKDILIEEIVYKFMFPFTSEYYIPGNQYTQNLNLNF
jgi:predicted dehydrogenase